jgi:glycosyltransferase involved in cell wall biosynthesis
VPRTWSAGGWFDLAARGAWRAQRALGVPYLNVFSNYRRFDACLRCLPGHDVVHERNGLYNAGVAMACRRLGLPYVVFFDADQLVEHDFMGTPITGLLRRRAGQLLRYNLRTARRVVCVSEPARARLVSAWQVPAERVVVLPNAVDVDRFRPSAEARAQVRASMGVGDRPVVIFVGNFHAWHDVATLLDAFARVSTSLPKARLLLAGQGPTHEAMVHRAASLGISDSVRFLGPVPHGEVPGLLASADVAVAPVPIMAQRSWLSPMKVFEYMASGAAVVATRSGQLAEVLVDGHNARLVPPGDAAAMAGALSALLGDPDRRARLGAQARQDAVDRHSWDRYVSCLEQVYSAAIADGGSPGPA